MSLLETTLKYIQTSERLIVVTVTLTVAGLICFFSERNGYLNFAGLPEWTRPAAQAVWVVSAVHVAIRTLMGFGALCRAALHRAISLPERYRRSRFENATIARLRGTGGLEREVLAFALHRDDDHISAEDSDQYRWLVSLRRKGLVEMTDADPRVVHYRIHPIAWRYMKSHPNQFVYRLPWAHAPWSEDYNETRMEAELDKRAAGKRTSFLDAGDLPVAINARTCPRRAARKIFRDEQADRVARKAKAIGMILPRHGL